MCQFQCNTGKDGNTSEVGLGGNVVSTLTRELVGKNYCVYMDNFFSSIHLFQRLLEDNIYATGTLRSNRKCFLVTVGKRGLASRGNLEFRQADNVVVTVWQDTRAVVILSTQHDPSNTTTVSRKQKDGSKVNVNCPQLIIINIWEALIWGTNIGNITKYG